MLTRALKLCSQIAVALAIIAVPASAVSISPGSTTGIGLSGGVFVTSDGLGAVDVPSGSLLGQFYNFVAPTNTRFYVTFGSVQNPGGTAATGIANLAFQAFNTVGGSGGASIGALFSMTDNPNGDYVSPFPGPFAQLLVATLLPGQSFSIRFSGSGLNTGGSYQASFLAQTPLPPALLLFGTALAGMGFLGRRRRKSSLAA